MKNLKLRCKIFGFKMMLVLLAVKVLIHHEIVAWWANTRCFLLIAITRIVEMSSSNTEDFEKKMKFVKLLEEVL